MVTEFAEIDIKPGMEDEFIAGVTASKPLFAAGKNCHGARLQRSAEHPSHFVLLVKWDAVSDHENFRNTPDFQTWRKNVAHCFAAPPRVWHGEDV